jgi:methionyl-tRNA synthetase
MKKLFITTAIPYVNAAPHIGHALEFVQADALARMNRAAGREVFFLSGADENAMKNVAAAEAEGVTVKELVDRNAKKFEELLAALNVSVDGFVRTSDPRHVKAAQALWNATKKEDIYKKSYSGLYCTGCEAFYSPDELINGECPEHPGKKLEVVEEENYFFKLSNYSGKIKELIETGTLRIVPETRKNEILSLASRGLQDFSVSRPASRARGWGVPVPGDETQTMYVWYDALANYISGLGYPEKEGPYAAFWEGDAEKLHVIGKGIIRFHAAYWPAMLLSAGLPLPTCEFVHGYVTVEGQKMSKTVGNVVDPMMLINEFGADAVRYYLLREIPAYEDGDFSMEKFKVRYNADLANGIGNFAARVSTLADGMAFGEGEALDSGVAERTQELLVKVRKESEAFRFNESLAALWELISFGDEYANRTAPWKIKDTDGKKNVMRNLVYILESVARELLPFLPETAQKIQSGVIRKDSAVTVQKIEALFPRLQ